MCDISEVDTAISEKDDVVGCGKELPPFGSERKFPDFLRRVPRYYLQRIVLADFFYIGTKILMQGLVKYHVFAHALVHSFHEIEPIEICVFWLTCMESTLQIGCSVSLSYAPSTSLIYMYSIGCSGWESRIKRQMSEVIVTKYFQTLRRSTLLDVFPIS